MPPKHIVLNPISHAVIIVFTLGIKNAASVYHLKDENGNTVRENVAADKWYTITAKFTPKEGKASFQFQNVNASTVYIASVTVSNDEFVEPVYKIAVGSTSYTVDAPDSESALNATLTKVETYADKPDVYVYTPTKINAGNPRLILKKNSDSNAYTMFEFDFLYTSNSAKFGVAVDGNWGVYGRFIQNATIDDASGIISKSNRFYMSDSSGEPLRTAPAINTWYHMMVKIDTTKTPIFSIYNESANCDLYLTNFELSNKEFVDQYKYAVQNASGENTNYTIETKNFDGTTNMKVGSFIGKENVIRFSQNTGTSSVAAGAPKLKLLKNGETKSYSLVEFDYCFSPSRYNFYLINQDGAWGESYIRINASDDFSKYPNLYKITDMNGNVQTSLPEPGTWYHLKAVISDADVPLVLFSTSNGASVYIANVKLSNGTL